jgi:signal transduction histidine kinase
MRDQVDANAGVMSSDARKGRRSHAVDGGESPPAHRGTPPSAASGVSRIALGFVLLALCALVIIPLIVQRRAERVRSSVDDIASPARSLVTRLQFSLSREMSSLRGFLLTGDTRSLENYDRSQRMTLQLFEDLTPLVNRLDPEVLAAFVETRTLSDQWHRRADDEEIARRREASPLSVSAISTEQQLFEEVLTAAGRLDLAIARVVLRSREETRAVERAAMLTTGLLGVLAIGAAATVGWLDRRARTLAVEAEQRRLELERALQESVRAQDARARLLRGVTHDVKNPLGAAKGYVELLQLGLRGELTPPQSEVVAGIRRSIDGALSIIADLLDLARADAGGLSVQRAPTELASVVTDAVSDYRATATTAGLSLDWKPPPRPLRIHSDAARVRQVLDNLLSNAIKYTPGPGQIQVEVRESVEDPMDRPGTWVVVLVRDTGPGIPLEEREIIFDEFTRLHDGTAVAGHGLGLAISRRIARLLGGDLTVEGRPGAGSTFALWLPTRAEPGSRADDRARRTTQASPPWQSDHLPPAPRAD